MAAEANYAKCTPLNTAPSMWLMRGYAINVTEWLMLVL